MHAAPLPFIVILSVVYINEAQTHVLTKKYNMRNKFQLRVNMIIGMLLVKSLSHDAKLSDRSQRLN